MRYIELSYKDKVYRNQSEINKILSDNGFYWLIDSEIEDAKIQIKKDTILWHSGNFYAGRWHYGIFRDGNFYGIWENGIWENGNFYGKWKSGINLSQDIKK